MKLITIISAITLIFIVESSIQGFTDRNCTNFETTGKYTENNPDIETSAFSKDFCRSLGKQNSTNKCCYVRYKANDRNFYNCEEVPLEKFWDIDTTIQAYEEKHKVDVKEFVCDSSSYLYGSLLLLLVFLF